MDRYYWVEQVFLRLRNPILHNKTAHIYLEIFRKLIIRVHDIDLYRYIYRFGRLAQKQLSRTAARGGGGGGVVGTPLQKLSPRADSLGLHVYPINSIHYGFITEFTGL
jgi:hypothetical protein